MAARSTRVILENRTGTNWALVKKDSGLDHGIWSDKPPGFVGNHAEWGSESWGFLRGTQGWVIYEVPSGDVLNPLLSLRLDWDNPYYGSNSYSASVDPPGQADGTGFSVGYFGGGGDDAVVTFVLLAGKCVVDSNSGEIACTLSQPLVAPQQRYAALWERRGGFSWQAQHGLNSTQYQQAFYQFQNQGFRLVHVSGYEVGSEERYATVWEQRDGQQWQARHGLNSIQYQQAFDQMRSEGYRLLRVSGYQVDSEDHYAAIWEYGSGPPIQARHGLSSTQYQEAFDQLRNEGYRLVWLNAYSVDGEDHYAAIWEQRGGVAWEARHGMTADQYQQTFDQLVSQGYRLVQVNGYSIAS